MLNNGRQCTLQNGQGIRLLLLDNIAAFYWVDAAVKPAVAGPGQAPSALTLQAVHSVAAAELRSLAKQLKLAVVVTKHSFKSASSAGTCCVNTRQIMPGCSEDCGCYLSEMHVALQEGRKRTLSGRKGSS